MTNSDYVRRIIGCAKLCIVGGILFWGFGAVNATENGMVSYECDKYAQAAIKPYYKHGKTFERWMIEIDGYHKHINMPIDPIRVAVTASVYSVSDKADQTSAYRVAYNVCESMYRDPLKVARHE